MKPWTPHLDASYMEDLLKIYQTNPEKLDPSWRGFFQGLLWKNPEAPLKLETEAEAEPQDEKISWNPMHRSSQATPPPGGWMTLEKGASSPREEINFWDQALKEIDSLPTPIRQQAWKSLLAAEILENFLQKKFLGQKRFSLEGLASLIPLLENCMEKAREFSTEKVVIGMSHRGRLNVLTHMAQMPYEELMGLFWNQVRVKASSGDVKYHLGYEGLWKKHIPVSVMYNPSHLESVYPVALGFAKEEQDRGIKVLPIILHGDGAFTGQGVVSETLNLLALKSYHTAGTLHIIMNNQIGFTTLGEENRSYPWPTDLAKSLNIPVLHVSAEDIDSVLKASFLAMSYREKFKKDIIIDLVGYRRWGHNETDEPRFTQPLMYKWIEDQKENYKIYGEKLLAENVISKDFWEKTRADLESELQIAWEKAKDTNAFLKTASWQQNSPNPPTKTLSLEILIELGEKILKVPENFSVHPKLTKIWEQRNDMLAQKQEVDWAMGELLALASLGNENISIRFSGQDTIRGTFSSRHSSLWDQNTGEKFCIFHPWPHIKIFDTPLSEEAILGFEYGYSLRKQSLVIWEAQFGDFFNGAQVYIDQFLASSQSKWGQTSSLTLLLPHGQEGMGPEHSSARLERFLQLSAEENWTVALPTTPAQYFHLLRKQSYQNRPLILMTPKSLLRHEACRSPLESFTKSDFSPLLVSGSLKNPKHILICSGKIFYDLHSFYETPDLAIVRLEQLYPFPSKELKEVLESFENSGEILSCSWVQEEPQNQGAWNHVKDFWPMAKLPSYIGPPYRSSPALGNAQDYKNQQKHILDKIHFLIL